MSKIYFLILLAIFPKQSIFNYITQFILCISIFFLFLLEQSIILFAEYCFVSILKEYCFFYYYYYLTNRLQNQLEVEDTGSKEPAPMGMCCYK